MDDSTAPAARVPGLGPHCVGRRVVVRRLLPGERGPSGGPAMTDVLGTMLAWDAAGTVVEREDGSRVSIPRADLVSGKPVPPRPSVRLRVTPAEAEHRALRGWPPVEEERLGDWVLRAAGGFSTRANSVLAVGSPDRPLEEALSAVTAFYDARSLPTWAQVVTGSDEDRALADAGWLPARPGEADTAFLVASVARLARALPRQEPAAGEPLVLTPEPTPGWLAGDDRALRDPASARAVLAGPAQVAFVAYGDPAVARGRVSVDDDWAGITDVWVSPHHRRRGLGSAVLRELVTWSAERGATTAYLQVRGDNPVAMALYEQLGFTRHHDYRYLAAPGR